MPAHTLPSLEELTAELATGFAVALRPALGRHAEDAARAVATGRALPAEAAAAAGDRPLATLVSFDADRIQSWVFASERLQVAGGASGVLDRLNQRVPELAAAVEGISGVVYSAGGGGLLVGPPCGDPERLAEEVGAALEAESQGLGFTVGALTATASDLAPSGAPAALSGPPLVSRFERLDGVAGTLLRLQVEVRQRKEETPPASAPPLTAGDGIVAERCPSCGLRPPSRRPVTDDGPGFWCGRCQRLRRSWLQEVGRREEDEGKPPVFEDLAKSSRRGRGFLAYVALDGNSMGRLFRRARTLLQLRALSEVTSDVYGAARDRVKELLTAGGFLDPEWSAESGMEPYLSLLSGGDEITVVLPASAAPWVAGELLRSVERGFEAARGEGGLLASAFAGDAELLGLLGETGAAAGVVAARASFPVRLLRRYAGDLQQAAKSACAAGGHRSALAFHLLTDSTPLASDLPATGELSLDAFDRLLAEAAAAEAVGVPLSAWQQLLAEMRREDDGHRTLGPRARREATAACAANFLRYQVARLPALADWWREVAPHWPGDGEGGEGAALRWAEKAAAGRLQRFLDLLSLEPVPRTAPPPPAPAPLEVTA